MRLVQVKLKTITDIDKAETIINEMLIKLHHKSPYADIKDIKINSLVDQSKYDLHIIIIIYEHTILEDKEISCLKP